MFTTIIASLSSLFFYAFATGTGAVYVFTFRDNTSTTNNDLNCKGCDTMYRKWYVYFSKFSKFFLISILIYSIISIKFFSIIQIFFRHEHEILHAPDRSHTDRFGESISLDHDVVVVGAPGDELKARTTWNFEQGNLVGWTRTGTAFDNQPTRGDNSNYRYVYGTTVNHGHRGTSMRSHNEGDRTGLRDELRDALYHYYGGDPQPSGFIGRYWIGTYEQNPDVTPFDTING